MKLVIVESPTKAKTINKYLGKEYIVKSSFGHVRDLPVKPKKRKTLAETMGVDPDNGWKAEYDILPKKSKIIKELKTSAKEADTVYLAADPDREGEAIAWHLSEILGKNNYKRVTYQEITKKAVTDAFDNPSTINTDLVDAYKARRYLDRVVGFQLSPLLWKSISPGLSAGRVQSVALKLIVEREKEIKAFTPEEYWTIAVNLISANNNTESFIADLVKEKNKKVKIADKNDAQRILEALKANQYSVIEQISKPAKSRPNPPFITSTLQQAASVRLGYGVKKTMILAQKLYENGYITYMRTDSTRLSESALSEIREKITKDYGKEYLPDSVRLYASSEKAQEAHEAIRPSNMNNITAALTGVDDDAKKLYDLIWKQALASQMTDARYETSSILIECGDFELKAKGRVMIFDGWQRILPPKINENEQKTLPKLKDKDLLEAKDSDNKKAYNPVQHFTKPPPRYSEASLVKELEKRGIGRPSTYAQIISTIQDRGYVRQEKKRFYAEKIGEIVSYQLDANFPQLMDYQFTANLEESLDKIAAHDVKWDQVLDTFYKDFRAKVLEAENNKNMKLQPIETEIHCDKCDRPMFLYNGKSGPFLGCSGYKLTKKDQCKNTFNLIKIDLSPFVPVEQDESEEGNEFELLEKKRCPLCSMAMDMYFLNEKTAIHICGNSPLCHGYTVEKGDFSNALPKYDGPEVTCDKCSSKMERKDGRFGPYFACTNTEECKNTRKILKSGEVAPPKEDPVFLEDMPCEKCGKGTMVIRDGARGLFLACSKFPRCRASGNVSAEILLKYKDMISPKFSKLIKEAEAACPKCQKQVLLRFSVKKKEYYFSCVDKKCKWIKNI